jgi:hypothetical protein
MKSQSQPPAAGEAEHTPTLARESRDVEITLNGLTRLVPIARVCGGCWWSRVEIVCRFKTGDKLHTLRSPIVDEVKPGEFAFRRRQVISNRSCVPFAYVEDVAATSKWAREKAQARSALQSAKL